MIIPLQTEKSLVYEKRKSRKNHLDCRLDTICHPRIALYINLRMAGKGIGPMEYWMINAAGACHPCASDSGGAFP